MEMITIQYRPEQRIIYYFFQQKVCLINDGSLVQPTIYIFTSQLNTDLKDNMENKRSENEAFELFCLVQVGNRHSKHALLFFTMARILPKIEPLLLVAFFVHFSIQIRVALTWVR